MTVTDAAGNPATVSLTFPLVAKGDQDLSGFAYSADSVTYGTTAPTVTAPTVARERGAQLRGGSGQRVHGERFRPVR